MSRDGLFTSADAPANGIADLYDYLRSDEFERQYIYRGQTQEYSIPLLPTAFRPFFSRTDIAVDAKSSLGRYSMRRCGSAFYGDVNFKIAQSVRRLFLRFEPDQKAVVEAVYHRVMRSADVATMQRDRRVSGELLSWFEAIERAFPAGEREILNRHRDEWKAIIDRYHRRVIRMFFFYFNFGYLMGTILAQQYGLHSECLDATTDLDVAVFFATHNHVDDYAAPSRNGVGIIYRLPYPDEAAAQSRRSNTDFYSLPPLIDAAIALRERADPDMTLPGMHEAFWRHSNSVFHEDEANAAKWRLPRAAMEMTRVWRQKAVVILPDELRKELPDKKPGVAGIAVPAFQYVEDIGRRNGIERFYFRHTGSLPSAFRLGREYLWPREDPLVPVFASGMTSVYPLGRFSPHVIPYRLDLIDCGYGRAQFEAACVSAARRHPLMFWDEDTREALANGAVVLQDTSGLLF